MFYTPTSEHLSRLSQPWCASFSGGKDSTSLVTWLEWLRRTGQLKADRPQLVQSDTGVEDPKLSALSASMMALLRRHGWECAVVQPRVHERLYNRILGIGNTPIHPGIRSMRWCTRATKIDPMERWRKENASGITLTGLRMGESTMRDGKLKRKGCSAGGECGIPDPSERTYSPILQWSTCHVVDWLGGIVNAEIRRVMADVFRLTKQLLEIYDVRIGSPGLGFTEPEVTAARFGCIGCPAICSEAKAPRSVVRRNGPDSPLNELYDVWFEARRRDNRCWRWHAKVDRTRNYGFGPIKMAVRKLLFARVMDIQQRAGIVLVTPEDETFIRDCWERKVYPRGWSEADELTAHPEAKEESGPLFQESDGRP